MNKVDEGYQLVFGGINVFVGMVSMSGVRSNTAESVSEPTIVVESDGEESVGTSEVGIIAESEELEMLQESDPDYDADSESILPLFEDRLGYGIEEEEYEDGHTSRQRGGRSAEGTPPGVVAGRHSVGQIGRASCRERVYVLV